MQLERVLIVVEQRIRQDGSYPGFDIRHMEGPLKSSGIVDNIDILYYNDYTPSCDDALISYCIQKKPQVLLLSLQNMALRKGGAPTPDTVWRITHQVHIPTVMFWFDIHSQSVVETLEHYLHSVTIHMILGANASSHKALPSKARNYVYAGLTFDDRLYAKPEGERDMSVGFLGNVNRNNRPQLIAELREFGISPYTAGGWGTAGWMPYEEWVGIVSRLKIGLNFSLLGHPVYQPVIPSDRERVLKALYWPAHELTRSYRGVKYLISRWNNPVPAMKHIMWALTKSTQGPRYMVRARVWETLWCRTFLLEEDNPVTATYFEPYVDYVPFTSVKDLADKIRYYLEHEEERDRIRMQGRATVEKYYDARVYWENLFETIGVQSATQHDHRPGEIWNKTYFGNRYLSNSSEER